MRCIVHLDMDCFYAQVEAVRLGIDCRTTPYALIQWGNLIAVNYPARDKGVRRFDDTPATAKAKVPELITSHIATYRIGDASIGYPENPPPRIDTHKVALEVYREASRRIFDISRRSEGVTVGKAGIDEAYLDVTVAAREELATLRAAHASAAPGGAAELTPEDVMEPSTRLIEDRSAEMEAWFAAHGTSLEAAYNGPMRALKRGEAGEAARALEGSRAYSVAGASGHAEVGAQQNMSAEEVAEFRESSLLLCAASRVVRRIRDAVYAELHYDCSAGIAHNRLLAKCISATHKPNQQTLLLPDRTASALFELPLTKLRGFGGKFGRAVEAVCGGATLCREAWLRSLEQLRPLDDFTFSAAELEDEGTEENAGGRPEAGKERRPSEASVSTYTFYRIRGFGGEEVADPAVPHYVTSSKIFHGFTTTLGEVPSWLVVLSSELCTRFADYAHFYVSTGRVLTTRLHVRHGQGGIRVFKRQSPLSGAEPLEEGEVAAVSTRDAARLGEDMRKAYCQENPAAPGSGTTPAAPNAALPPLRMIVITLSGLKLRGGKGAPEELSESQPTLLSMFASMASGSGNAASCRKTGASPVRSASPRAESPCGQARESSTDSDAVVVEEGRPGPAPASSLPSHNGPTKDHHRRQNLEEDKSKRRRAAHQPVLLDFFGKGASTRTPDAKRSRTEGSEGVSIVETPEAVVISSDEDAR